MKHILLLFAASALLRAGTAQAQQLTAAQVPAAARAAFKAKFPTVKTARWEKEGAAYEAGFRLSGKAMSAVITAAGELRETETDVAVGQLPAAVRATLARNYKAFQVKEAAVIVKADGRTVYEAEVNKGGKSVDVLFAADGRVVPE